MKLPAKLPLYKPTMRIGVFVATVFVFIFAIPSFWANTDESYVLTNGAFAVMISLAAICFSFARCNKDPEQADRVLWAGERLLHGSLLVIVSTIIRYVTFNIAGTAHIAEMQLWFAVVIVIALTLRWWTFFTGLIFSSTGFRIISDILADRMFRHEDWDDIL